MKKALIIFLIVFILVGCETNSSENDLFSNGLLAVEIDDKWGYVNKKGEVVIQALYDNAAAFHDNKAVVLINDKMQLIDTDGKNLLSKSYDRLYRDVLSNTIIYNSDDKWGLMNEKGEIITDALYDFFGLFSDGLALIGVGDKYGFMDTSGKMIVSLTYDDAKSFSNGLAAVKKEGLWGFVDSNGSVYINFTFKKVESFDDYGYAIVQSSQDNTWGLINKNTKLLVLKSFNEIEGNGPIYAAKLGLEYMLYKSDGTRFNTQIYEKVWGIDGYFANLQFKGEDLNFWFNQDGTVFKSKDYDSSFFGELRIDEDNVTHFTVKDNKFIEVYFHNSTYRFEGSSLIQIIENEQFIIERNLKVGILNKDKTILIEFIYDLLYKTDDGYFIFVINDKFGFMDSKFKTVVTATYTNINLSKNITY
jgi:hypothetical protein